MKNYTHIRTEEALDKLIARKFSCAYMSNCKWVKLLDVLVKHAHLFQNCIVKLIWEEDHIRKLLIDKYTSYQFDYYETSMESMISGFPSGWYYYKEIEWISFPKSIDFTQGNKDEDIEQLYRIVEQVGKLCAEMDEKELKIYGYK